MLGAVGVTGLGVHRREDEAPFVQAPTSPAILSRKGEGLATALAEQAVEYVAGSLSWPGRACSASATPFSREVW